VESKEEVLKSCDECGATIYPEHLQKHAAELYKDRLLCPHCLKEQKEQAETGRESDGTDSPIALVAEGEEVDPSKPSTSIHTFGGGVGAPGTAATSEREWQRPLLGDSRNARRCRTFHCKLTDGSFAHLNMQINEWVDTQDDVEIKFALSNIGVVEGKHTDPHLIITVFY
jgi:hypothetical protein